MPAPRTSPQTSSQTGPSSRAVGVDLLAAKLAIPQLPIGLVPRPRLVDQLDRGSASQVTLVSAGPGWGKTMLVAGWAASRSARRRVAWVSLDSDDNDPVLFWAHVLAAVRGTTGEPSATLRGLAVRPPLGTSALRRIIVGLTELQEPTTLVLDDFSEIRSSEVLDAIRDLLRHPSALRLVLITRSDPPLHLHRLRLAGGLTDVRAADLAFTSSEAGQLLHNAGVRFTLGQRERLLRRTEGWAAGLRLAALSAAGTGSGNGPDDTDAYEDTVAEYLLEEVVAGLSEEQRGFLLQTSVADKLCGELADVLSGGSGGQRKLERLERSNAFVVALGPGHYWFRYHALMAELLRHLLFLDDRKLFANLHGRAARWFAERGDALTAVRHAVRARDWRLAGELVVRFAAARVLSSERRAFAALLAEIPADELGSSAELRTRAALMRFLDRDYDGFAAQVQQARAMLKGRDPESAAAVSVFLCVADLLRARIGGDMAGVRAATDQLLEWGADPRRGALHTAARQYEAPALSNRGVASVWADQLDEAEPYLRSSIEVATATGAELTLLNSLGHLGLLELGRGRLGAAVAAAGEGLEMAEQGGWTELAQVIAVYLVLAEVHWQRNEARASYSCVANGLAAQRNDPEWTPYVALQAVQAEHLIAAGEVSAAASLLRKVEAERDGWVAPARLRRRLAALEAGIKVAQGRPDAALDGLKPLIGEASHASEELSLCAARADLAMGAFSEAQARVAVVRDGPNSSVKGVEAWVITALAAHHMRDDHDALLAMDQAVTQAEPEGIARPFVSIDESRVEAILRHQLRLGRGGTFAESLLSAIHTSADARPTPAPLADPLSDREKVVLSHIALFQTNEQIAAELYISVNTVKAHARSIYRKLSVSNRREAVIRARDLGLL